MKNLGLRVSVTFLSLLSAAYLTGCSGFEAGFPPASTNPEQVSLGPISGSVFGGHSPLVGAHIYLVQASTSGYGAPATSLLNANSTATSSSYPAVVNASDPIIPTFGDYFFESTDASGSFNLSGDYTCTTGSNGANGPPVYIYAFGGTPATPSASDVHAASSVTISNVNSSSTVQTATYTFTIANTTPFTVGEYVNFSGFFNATIAAAINGESAKVLASNLTAVTFSATLPDPTGATGTFVTSGTVTAQPAFNPAIVNVAVLGNCPSTHNLAGQVSFVFLNEVSTVAAAYALSGFTSTTPANINFLNIGSSPTNLQGLLNAGLNAAQLYNIQGTVVGTGTNGEGHIANLHTPVGNGTVSQSLIDTLADSLAACVDSGNTTTVVANMSVNCNTLLSYATSDGTATGTVPADTGTAALNIAHNPYNARTNYVSKIYNLGATTPPYAPRLANAPNDFTVSIAYTGGGIGTSVGGAPHSVAADGSGNIWTASGNGVLSEFSPLGAPATSAGYTNNNLNSISSVSLDAQSANVWVTGATAIGRFTNGGQNVGIYKPGGTDIQDTAFDSSGHAWVSASSNQLYEYTGGGTLLGTATGNGLNFPDALAIEPTTTGTIWLINENSARLSAFTQSGAAVTNSPFTNKVQEGEGVAIDSGGYIWTTSLTGSIGKFSTAGAAVTGTPFAIGAPTGNGNTPGSDGIAIDGANSVWIASPTAGSIYQLSNAGTNLSGNKGYYPTNNEPDGLAIDGSGNVWFNTLNTNTLYELVGAATPVVTPIAAAVANNTLGTAP
jgi:hypothetical protein